MHKHDEQMKEERWRTDRAAAPTAPDAANGQLHGVQIMDKRIIVEALYQRAKMLRMQAEGVDRLAQIIGAASDTDYALFSALREVFK